MNRKILILALICAIGLAAIAAVSASGEVVNFGDFNLTIDGTLTDNQTDEDNSTTYQYKVSKDYIQIMVIPGKINTTALIDNFVAEGYEKVEDVNGFTILKVNSENASYEYIAINTVMSDKDTITFFFDNPDTVKPILESFVKN